VIVEIVILAMIAAFLGLRLYSVLGRRPEQNEEPVRRRIEQPDIAGLGPRPLTPRLPEANAGPGEPPRAAGAGNPRFRCRRRTGHPCDHCRRSPV
jgi:hypothetical protein